jgi:hypothetical protein
MEAGYHYVEGQNSKKSSKKDAERTYKKDSPYRRPSHL